MKHAFTYVRAFVETVLLLDPAEYSFELVMNFGSFGTQQISVTMFQKYLKCNFFSIHDARIIIYFFKINKFDDVTCWLLDLFEEKGFLRILRDE